MLKTRASGTSGPVSPRKAFLSTTVPLPLLSVILVISYPRRFRVITQQCSHCQKSHELTPLFSLFNVEQKVQRKLARTQVGRSTAQVQYTPVTPVVDLLVWSLPSHVARSLCACNTTGYICACAKCTITHAHSSTIANKSASTSCSWSWSTCNAVQILLVVISTFGRKGARSWLWSGTKSEHGAKIGVSLCCVLSCGSLLH